MSLITTSTTALSLALFPVLLAGGQDIVTVSAVLEDGDQVADPGDRVTVEATYFNAGDDDLDDIPIGYFLSSDDRLDPSDILLDTDDVDVSEGEFEDESEQIPLPGSAQGGSQFILVAADFNNTLVETNEDNNVVAIPIDIEGPSVTPFGQSAGGTNIGALGALTAPSMTQPLTVRVSDIPSGGPGFVYASFQPSTETRFGGTFLADFNSAVVLEPFSLASGPVTVAFDLPPGMAGQTLYVQAAARDATQPDGIAFTNGLQVSLD